MVRRTTVKYPLRILFTFAAALLLFQLASAQVPQLNPFSADLHINSTRSDRGPLEVAGQVYVGSGHIRMNMEGSGHKTALLTDFATKTTDILLIEQQVYIEQKAGQGPGHGPNSMTEELKPYDPDHPCANQPNVTCKKIGVEEVSGRSCDHWEVTDKEGRLTNLWIDQKLHFPVKVVTKDTEMLLTNIRDGEPDPSLFTIPPAYHKMDLGAMMPQGMQHPPQN